MREPSKELGKEGGRCWRKKDMEEEKYGGRGSKMAFCGCEVLSLWKDIL
jgi:hypothetical protein